VPAGTPAATAEVVSYRPLLAPPARDKRNDVTCAHVQDRLQALMAQRHTEILSMRAEIDGLRLALEVLLLLLLLLLLLMCGALAGEESNHKQRITRSQEALAQSSPPRDGRNLQLRQQQQQQRQLRLIAIGGAVATAILCTFEIIRRRRQ